jgi:PEP-CTERM motif
VASQASASTNLIINGSFETGDFTGWTQGGNTGYTFVALSPFDGMTAPDGVYFAALGPVGSDGTLSQTFVDVPGETYLASFYYASDGDTPNDFTVTGPGSLTLGPIVDDSAHGFVEYYGSFVGSGLDTITFTFRNDPGYLGLDDVSVTAETGTVPEPSTWAMMLLGFAGLGLVGYRQRQKLAGATIV